MDKYLLLTRHNKAKSDELKSAHDLIGLNFTVVDEYFETDLKIPGGKQMPNLVAIHDGQVIHQTDNPQDFASFEATAEAKLEAFLE